MFFQTDERVSLRSRATLVQTMEVWRYVDEVALDGCELDKMLLCRYDTEQWRKHLGKHWRKHLGAEAEQKLFTLITHHGGGSSHIKLEGWKWRFTYISGNI